MGIRPGRLAMGIVAVAAALGAVLATANGAGSSPVSPRVVTGAVTAAGIAEEPDPAWQVEHPSSGRYVVTVPGDRIDLDVTLWQEIADIRIVPLGGGATEVRFTAPDGPVDTGFSFTTVARR